MSSPGSARRGQKRRRPTKTPVVLFDGPRRQLLDLNSPPAVEESGNRDSLSINEPVSHSRAAGVVVALTPQVLERAESNIGMHSIPINVEEINDDAMMYSSTRSLPRARQQVTRTQHIVIIDDDSETIDAPAGAGLDEHVGTLVSLRMSTRQHDRSRASSSNLVIDTLDAPAATIILPTVTQPLPEPVEEVLEDSPPEPVEEVPKKLKFSCPVCMNELVDASSTVCGHIFCQVCIKTAVRAQKKCPTCRRKLTMKNFHRVYLPMD